MKRFALMPQRKCAAWWMRWFVLTVSQTNVALNRCLRTKRTPRQSVRTYSRTYVSMSGLEKENRENGSLSRDPVSLNHWKNVKILRRSRKILLRRKFVEIFQSRIVEICQNKYVLTLLIIKYVMRYHRKTVKLFLMRNVSK